MPHISLTVDDAKFFALGVVLTMDLVWWRDALIGPPSKRRDMIAIAIFGLSLPLITMFAIVFL
jgi:hypothetical protein